jgi:hypothetical protein
MHTHQHGLLCLAHLLLHFAQPQLQLLVDLTVLRVNCKRCCVRLNSTSKILGLEGSA